MGRVGFLQHIQNQWWKVAPVEHVDLTGKTVVVIGANVGLGFEAAKHFASMNPKRLVLGCRSQEKGQAALQGKQASTISTPGRLTTLISGSHTSHRF
jgi:NAD(P)-dependent dehydrogenase (short-subunit alcohol dehydrogenase family)